MNCFGVRYPRAKAGLLLEFRVLEVMQPRVSEGGAEEVELERLPLRGREPHRLHPVHLQLLAGIRLVKGMRDGRLGLSRDPLGSRESLEIVIRVKIVFTILDEITFTNFGENYPIRYGEYYLIPNSCRMSTLSPSRS